MERTLIIIKPEGVQRGLIGQILARFEQRGLKFVGLKMLQMSPALAEEHYAVHKGKPFYTGLVKHITSGPVVVGVVEGRGAIKMVRTMMGATNAAEAAPGTIRGDFALEIGYNIIHGSDGPETAAREISLFFKPEELLDYRLVSEPWLYEEQTNQ
ncbi:MAG: nucleoside-diphosphate kinase [Thermogemmatispora sp.]|uniref:nucleoside-diphosphate kinase n=1 Tax=Thermogemmatispora sp. TaxID=1968838 RepID=UPI00260E58EE|nr:nucleoside-diphosphate kinase [Thermogemmatispora sp.]MBX5456792.1 nucleoside-diphosphate kinase [Thermogemmatispora sp.]